MSTNIDELKKQLAHTKSQHSDQDEIRILQNTRMYLQCRWMKINLIFTNLVEQRTLRKNYGLLFTKNMLKFVMCTDSENDQMTYRSQSWRNSYILKI